MSKYTYYDGRTEKEYLKFQRYTSLWRINNKTNLIQRADRFGEDWFPSTLKAGDFMNDIPLTPREARVLYPKVFKLKSNV